MSLGVWDTNFAAKKRTRAAAAAAVGRRSGRGCSYGNHLRTKSKCQTSSRTCLSNHRNLLGLLVRILHCWMFQKGMCMIASIRWLIRESVTRLLWQLHTITKMAARHECPSPPSPQRPAHRHSRSTSSPYWKDWLHQAACIDWRPHDKRIPEIWDGDRSMNHRQCSNKTSGMTCRHCRSQASLIL